MVQRSVQPNEWRSDVKHQLIKVKFILKKLQIFPDSFKEKKCNPSASSVFKHVVSTLTTTIPR